MSNSLFILASSSPVRKALLEKLQIAFHVISPDIDETPMPDEKPDALALRLAMLKAKAVKDRFPTAYIIGADQVIMHENIRLDKPGTPENAARQLQLVSGKSIDSYTGLCLLNAYTGNIHAAIEYCKADFRVLSLTAIQNYIKRDKPLHCAGSIKAESLGISLLTAFYGRDPTALLGLPMMKLTDFLLTEGLLPEFS